MTLLSLRSLTVRRGPCPVVDGVSLDIAAGELVGLIGPNGAGKTSLMRGALGLLPHEGASSLAALPARDRARSAAWLPQAREIAWPVTVETLVRLGRLPHGRRETPEDRAAVMRALDQMGLTAFATRKATALSGGEQARALIARALAQDTPLLIADEPTAGLDPAAQIATLKLFAALARQGHGILVSLHDLGLAARYCTRLVLLGAGRIVADGPPSQVLTEDRLAQVFHLRARMIDSPDGPVFQPLDVLS
ncbi:ABC transporter ATP-binding protein [Thalassococcus sp. CAU 1522]|uniref:ABC transporter ATP-binding protein n=1 Tax=Thalassococcus arenae TaxID=2851652 RepID=A0ABS6NA92_9RHOB|nr:ABC transporter ATP-binding protein [Thalassococcus arenae]MBV2360504.1 ABC transporter ATP-binding protein [Thalassococcus arenae]